MFLQCRVRYFHFSDRLFSEKLLISAFFKAQPSGRPQCPFHEVVVKVKWLRADEMVRAVWGTQQALSNTQLLAGWHGLCLPQPPQILSKLHTESFDSETEIAEKDKGNSIFSCLMILFYLFASSPPLVLTLSSGPQNPTSGSSPLAPLPFPRLSFVASTSLGKG